MGYNCRPPTERPPRKDWRYLRSQPNGGTATNPSRSGVPWTRFGPSEGVSLSATTPLYFVVFGRTVRLVFVPQPEAM